MTLAAETLNAATALASEEPSGVEGVMLVTWNEEIAGRVSELLAGFPELELVYLFGSRVDGSLGPLSDYDFAVLTKDTRSIPTLRARLVHELGHLLATNRIDIVILNQAPIELAYAVIAQGKPIYQRNETTRVEYEARVMSCYGDFLPVLRAQRNEIRRGGEHAARVQRYREALGRAERKISQIRAAQDKGSR